MQFDVSVAGRLALMLCTRIGGRDRIHGREMEVFSFRQYKHICNAWRNATGTGENVLLSASKASLAAVFGDETGARIEKLRQGRNISDALHDLALEGIIVMAWDDGRFPDGLKEADHPFLFLIGDRSLLAAPCRVAVVGTRDAGGETLAFARNLGRHCGERNIAVVSGGAVGVDSSVLSGALESRGAGIFILPCGLKTKQAQKCLEKLEGRYLLMSEVQPEYPFSSINALRRNGMIYNLSHAAVVVSAHKGKGGSWQGACNALKAGKPPVFVRRGEDEGNAALVERGGIWLDKPEIDFFFEGNGV